MELHISLQDHKGLASPSRYDFVGGASSKGQYPLAAFYAEAPARSGLVLGFGAIELLDIDPALGRVRDTLQALT